MKEFLIESGFTLQEYPDGFFWILRKHKECFVQIDSNFDNITLYQDGWIDNNLTYEELVSAINQINSGEWK